MNTNTTVPAFVTAAIHDLTSLGIARLAAATATAFALYGLSITFYSAWRRYCSPLRHLPGPRDGATFLFGHINEMMSAENFGAQMAWRNEFGGTFTMKGMLGTWALVTTDPRALTHVLFASHIFQKPTTQRRGIEKLIGKGILFVEGHAHRDQRRILNPAFGFAHVREMAEVFMEKASDLADFWNAQCSIDGTPVTIDVLQGLSRVTLDIIGKTGFGHDFNRLQGGEDELASAFGEIFRTDVTRKDQVRIFLNNNIPFLRDIVPGHRTRMTKRSKALMHDLGMKMVQEKKAALLANASLSGKLDKKALGGKDLLSLLLQANLAEDLEPHQRLSDEAVLDQIPAFLVAGHETTANSTTWAMLALARNQECQTKLRDELAQLGDSPSVDVLNALPYLDQVVRETLRLHAVVSTITREVFRDDVIPLSKPTRLSDGQVIDHIKVRKGDQVIVPITLVHHNAEMWGPDVDEFRPERWNALPAAASALPGITPNLLTFIGGPRACIGHRFAVVEMKSLLFHIVKKFEFSLTDPTEIWTRSGPLVKVQIRGSGRAGLRMNIRAVA